MSSLRKFSVVAGTSGLLQGDGYGQVGAGQGGRESVAKQQSSLRREPSISGRRDSSIGPSSSIQPSEENGPISKDRSRAKSGPRAVFDKYDVDGSGAINVVEFRRLCYDMGYFLNEKELALDVKILDVDGDGEISYDECMLFNDIKRN
jgi:hypothetical protein